MSTDKNAFVQSPNFGFIQSRNFARGARPQVTELEVQTLLQIKQWPGLGLANLAVANPYGVFRPLGSGGTNPGVDYCQNFRRHRQSRAIQWLFDSASYNGEDTYIGVGHVPRVSGYPSSIHGDPAVLTFPYVGRMAPFAPPVNEDWTTELIPDDPRLNWDEYHEIYRDNTSTHVDQTLDFYLTGEFPFAGILDTCIGRLLARNFPAFANGVYPERFSEYDNYNAPFPYPPTSDFDMSPDPRPRVNTMPGFLTLPNFFPNQIFAPTINDSPLLERLCSYWFFPSDDFGALATPSDGRGESNFPVHAIRSRFRINRALPYFIADAMVVEFAYGTHGPLGFDSTPVNKLHAVSVVEQGNTAVGEVMELGFYGTGSPQAPTDYQGETDFVVVGDGLSYGGLRFCILGQTYGEWAAENVDNIV